MNIYNYYRSMNSPDLWNTFQATKNLIANSNALIDLPMIKVIMVLLKLIFLNNLCFLQTRLINLH